MLLDLPRKFWHCLPLTGVSRLIQLRDIACGFVSAARLRHGQPTDRKERALAQTVIFDVSSRKSHHTASLGAIVYLPYNFQCSRYEGPVFQAELLPSELSFTDL